MSNVHDVLEKLEMINGTLGRIEESLERGSDTEISEFMYEAMFELRVARLSAKDFLGDMSEHERIVQLNNELKCQLAAIRALASEKVGTE